MTTLYLLCGTLMSIAFTATMVVMGVSLQGGVVLVALGMIGVPFLGRLAWGDLKGRMGSASGGRVGGRIGGGGAELGVCEITPPPPPARDCEQFFLEAFETSQPPLLGRGERPFAFESLSEARRAARRLPAGTGILYCDGFHFLTGARVSDRDLARSYIRSVYALVPGQAGRPVLHVVGRAPSEPRRVSGPAVPLVSRQGFLADSGERLFDPTGPRGGIPDALVSPLISVRS